jgi:ribosomal protein S18 acetylase RimI-like enzyme
MFVRSAAASDLPAVRELLVESWHATFDGIYGAEKVNEIIGSWHSLPALKARLESLNGEFVVADDGGGVAGMAFASAAADGKQVTLHQLYIRPLYQGRGAGTLLLAEIIDCFPDAETLRLEVEPVNEKAVAFYKARGFAEVGRTENCGQDQSGIPALILERTLALA